MKKNRKEKPKRTSHRCCFNGSHRSNTGEVRIRLDLLFFWWVAAKTIKIKVKGRRVWRWFRRRKESGGGRGNEAACGDFAVVGAWCCSPVMRVAMGFFLQLIGIAWWMGKGEEGDPLERGGKRSLVVTAGHSVTNFGGGRSLTQQWQGKEKRD